MQNIHDCAQRPRFMFWWLFMNILFGVKSSKTVMKENVDGGKIVQAIQAAFGAAVTGIWKKVKAVKRKWDRWREASYCRRRWRGTLQFSQVWADLYNSKIKSIRWKVKQFCGVRESISGSKVKQLSQGIELSPPSVKLQKILNLNRSHSLISFQK